MRVPAAKKAKKSTTTAPMACPSAQAANAGLVAVVALALVVAPVVAVVVADAVPAAAVVEAAISNANQRGPVSSSPAFLYFTLATSQPYRRIKSEGSRNIEASDTRSTRAGFLNAHDKLIPCRETNRCLCSYLRDCE